MAGSLLLAIQDFWYCGFTRWLPVKGLIDKWMKALLVISVDGSLQMLSAAESYVDV